MSSVILCRGPALPSGWDQHSGRRQSPRARGDQEGLLDVRILLGRAVSTRLSLRATAEVQVRLKRELPGCQGYGGVMGNSAGRPSDTQAPAWLR